MPAARSRLVLLFCFPRLDRDCFPFASWTSNTTCRASRAAPCRGPRTVGRCACPRRSLPCWRRSACDGRRRRASLEPARCLSAGTVLTVVAGHSKTTWPSSCTNLHVTEAASGGPATPPGPGPPSPWISAGRPTHELLRLEQRGIRLADLRLLGERDEAPAHWGQDAGAALGDGRTSVMPLFLRAFRDGSSCSRFGLRVASEVGCVTSRPRHVRTPQRIRTQFPSRLTAPRRDVGDGEGGGVGKSQSWQAACTCCVRLLDAPDKVGLCRNCDVISV